MGVRERMGDRVWEKSVGGRVREDGRKESGREGEIGWEKREWEGGRNAGMLGTKIKDCQFFISSLRVKNCDLSAVLKDERKKSF